MPTICQQFRVYLESISLTNPFIAGAIIVYWGGIQWRTQGGGGDTTPPLNIQGVLCSVSNYNIS